MYDTYGNVKVEKYSYNKGEYFVSISPCYLSYKKGNLKTSVMYHGSLNIDNN